MTTLADLKAGDLAVIERSGTWGSHTVVSVLKATRTQIVTNETGRHEQRWRIDSGRLVGGSGYHVPYLIPATPTLLAQIAETAKRTRLIRRLKDDTMWGKLSTEVLTQIVALLPAPPTEGTSL